MECDKWLKSYKLEGEKFIKTNIMKELFKIIMGGNRAFNGQ